MPLDGALYLSNEKPRASRQIELEIMAILGTHSYETLIYIFVALVHIGPPATAIFTSFE